MSKCFDDRIKNYDDVDNNNEIKPLWLSIKLNEILNIRNNI